MVMPHPTILKQPSWHTKGLKPELAKREDARPQLWDCLWTLSMGGGGNKGVPAWQMCVLDEGQLPCEGAVGGPGQTKQLIKTSLRPYIDKAKALTV